MEDSTHKGAPVYRTPLGFLRFVMLCAALALCLPLSALAADAVQSHTLITPPPGWVRENLKGSRSAALGFVLAQWLSFERGDEEYIQVGSRPSYGFTDESFQSAYRIILTREGQRIYAYRRQRFCHNEVGWYVKHLSTSFTYGDIVEDMYLVDGSKVYFASYYYPPKLQPLPNAERAIASLCVPSPVKPLVLPVAFSAPPGWLTVDAKHASTPVWPGTLALFYYPRHPGNVLILSRYRAEGEAPSASDRAAEKIAEAAMKRDNVKEAMLSYETDGIQPLCNNQTGWLLKYTLQYGRQRFAVEQMVLFGQELYGAMYIRPVSEPAFKPASAALRTLCPLTKPSPSPSPSPSATPVPTPSAVPSPLPTAT
jgi:hypothetical protein